ncbi:DNA-methyltransferase [Streptomonospora nanhaiensis]|uniref:DNA-methyltransferase n=1 Tax=Streptomonospora nanhaiensis TaxID=1323731 RepID=UPI001C38F953|nr:DNA methyltransferase [Streptomonospora nanhaiensis]MBV2366954.1 hypothetical protein [Streptomonospora nanhaiensis]
MTTQLALDTPRIDHADALTWLADQPPECARAVIYDPPYAVGSPVRGRDDGAAGSVAGPFGFLHRTLELSSHTLTPGGIVVIFADWRRMPDLAYIASMVGLRAATQVAWVRSRPGTGGLMRSAWDPILVAARGTADAIDRAAIPNVVHADYPSRRRHPYEKPSTVYQHILARVVRPGDLVLDPFAGSGSSAVAATAVGGVWRGCDIDPAYASAGLEAASRPAT